MQEEARLQKEVEALLKQAEEIDQQEDSAYGKDKRGDELPAELAFGESRLKKIQEAKEALEQEVRAQAEQKQAKIASRPSGRGRLPQAPDAVPAAKAQRNFTDPESLIMPSSENKGSFMQGYNCQAAVDNKGTDYCGRRCDASRQRQTASNAPAEASTRKYRTTSRSSQYGCGVF